LGRNAGRYKKYLSSSGLTDPYSMNASEVNLILKQVLKTTRDMLAYAREENWVEVAKLEAERQKFFVENLSGVGIEKAGETGRLIQEVITIDKETQELVMKARNEIREELIQLNKDKHAAKAYGAK